MISAEDYQERVQEILQFFQGKDQVLVRELRRKMHQAAEALRFEEAAALRDRVRAVTETLKAQHVVSSRLVQADVIGLAESAETAAAAILFIRFGAVTGLARFVFRNSSQSREEILSDLIPQYYRRERFIPP